MRDPAPIVAPARSLAEISNQWDLLDGKEQRTMAEFRAAKAKLLIEARADPKWGARGDGFVEFVEKRLRMSYRTAHEWMTAAGWKPPKVPGAGRKEGVHCEIRNEQKPERRTDTDLASDDGPSEIAVQRPRITDEEREAAYRREVDAGRPEPMERREQATHSLVAFVSEARAQLRRITERNLHLTDVTTSPEDFMRAKQMFIDIVNLCLDELSKAGVLDGKEQRRQMQLLKGGLE